MNEEIQKKIPGKSVTYLSIDSMTDTNQADISTGIFK